MKWSIDKVKEEDVKPENSILVCVPYGWEAVDGSLTGECCDCGRMILYGPRAPKVEKRICVPCFMKNLEKAAKGNGSIEMKMTEAQLEELRDHFKK